MVVWVLIQLGTSSGFKCRGVALYCIVGLTSHAHLIGAFLLTCYLLRIGLYLHGECAQIIR